MNFNYFVHELKSEMQKALPGLEAQKRMAPYARRTANQLTEKDQIKESAVLILFYPYEEHINTVLMLRPQYDGVHSGQVSFPGGRKEHSDSNAEETALREAQEELGILPNKVEILGRLTDLYIPPSNSLVTPVVGFSNQRPNFVPDKREVAAIITTNVFHFLNEEIISQMEVTTKLGILKSPCYLVKDHKIWGATAMMISELTTIIAKMR